MATLHTLFMPTMIHTLMLYLLLIHPLATTSSSIHELLRSRGLPAGLFPKNGVKSYELDEHDQLRVYLEAPCVAKFETRVFFDSVVRANLSYGGLTGVDGLSQEELFIWLPVKDIIVSDPSSGIILIDIGLALKKLSLSLFEETPICNPQDVLVEKNLARMSSNWKFEE
ncbi:unnamed protein product [Fraxinus pennsylvanica]|uniref:Uncharacterized protein n=1 Tax=Fraxinus pennsylvanica TaxID=56036 RepID=A0AAD2DJ56_9LAMI|nr:unnamed protein product [Fraxinus pennsylvanica]